VKQLADQAAWSRGVLADQQDGADPVSWMPAYTPLVANWRYAFASACGEFERDGYDRRDGSAIGAVFGALAVTEFQQPAPIHWEDRSGRHLWWRFWGDLSGLPWWALLLPPLALAAWFARLAVGTRTPAPSDSSTAR
jgi:hypothetical protein